MTNNKFASQKEATRARATELYLEIEKHFALGGEPLRIRDIGEMLGSKPNSNGLPAYYVRILTRWGLIQSAYGTQRTIILKPRNYPPVEWRRFDDTH
jgi:hypothetical protein